ncbi:prepilin peptidase [Candidatus Gottesmanbacteria bacterium]|nr:prepilin peptidase [Candidatus Gottesmanbacteria bacterium]
MIFVLFILGLCIGSFLNVLIDRLSNGETILGRSHCDYCKKTLKTLDLIPLLSFVMLKGKCRYCHKKLSWQYPVVELITGLLFVISYTSIIRIIELPGSKELLILRLIIISGLIVIFFADLKYRIISDEILVVLLLTTLAYKIFITPGDLIISFISGIVLFLIFVGLFAITRGRGMGLGDVKYVFFMGLLLGFPASVVAFYIAFLTGAVVSIILIIRGRKRFGQTIAFGPFLVIATIAANFWGDYIWLLFRRIIGMA